MSPARSALVISIHPRPSEREGNGTEIMWRFGNEVIPQRLSCGTEKLRRLRHDLALAYNQIHGVNPSPRNLLAARGNLRHVLKTAHGIGREFLGAKGLPPNVAFLLRLHQLQTMEWQIEAESRSMFPLDMLPLGWLHQNREDFSRYLSDHPDLSIEALASMLPCWQWPVIRRFLHMDQSTNGTLQHGRKVRVAFVGDGAPTAVADSLRKGMRKAHRMLIDDPVVSTTYQIEEPWPDDQTQDTGLIVANLARHLTNPEFMPRGSHHPTDPAAVTHFFCHGRTSAGEKAGCAAPKHGMDFELHIGQGGKTDGHHEISIRDLQDQMEHQQQEQPPQAQTVRQRTLIFMNACGGATQSAKDDVALASVLFGKRHPAVIASEAIVDGGTARRISMQFYNCLRHRVPAHVALWQAQRRLMCETTTQRNPYPAALLYSCYGRHDCTLAAVERSPADPAEKDTRDPVTDLFFPPYNYD